MNYAHVQVSLPKSRIQRFENKEKMNIIAHLWSCHLICITVAKASSACTRLSSFSICSTPQPTLYANPFTRNKRYTGDPWEKKDLRILHCITFYAPETIDMYIMIADRKPFFMLFHVKIPQSSGFFSRNRTRYRSLANDVQGKKTTRAPPFWGLSIGEIRVLPFFLPLFFSRHRVLPNSDRHHLYMIFCFFFGNCAAHLSFSSSV